MSEKRVHTITKSVDELIRRIENWMRDDSPQASPIVPEDCALAIEATIITIREGDIPQCCQQLAIAVPRLGEEYRKYENRENGSVRPETGAPGPAFWSAASAVAKARMGADAPLIERLEPVAMLIKQGVSPEQIGQHIYGRRGVGPFIMENRAVDLALIEQEAANPGSVIPKDWIPPWHKALVENRQKELAGRLAAFDEARDPRRYEDPGTVESMLRDGCYIQQIEVGKNVTRAQVLEVANELGIKAIDGPTYRPGIATVEVDANSDDSNPPEDAPTGATANIKALVIAEFERTSGESGAAEIARTLRDQGHQVHWRQVASTIQAYKKTKQEQPASV